MTHRDSEAFCDRELSRIILSEFDRVEKKIKKHRHPGNSPRTDEMATAVSEDIDITDGSDLLSDEEQSFITETTAWLRPRDNKDTILGRIWTLLTEEDPDAYFQPPETESRETPATATDTGEEDQSMPEPNEKTP
ncbi:MAG: hypothetical protein OEL83_14250 [Desulforhopalus sp.]|nr:hypothetical protein [Desulforhopalus sp.]